MAATKQHCKYCFDILQAHFDNNTNPKHIPLEFPNATSEYPLFVTWEKQSRQGGETRLRGCIGNFSPMNLASGLREYALTSALRDSRFNPIEEREMPLLVCSVSLLTDFEEADGYLDWEIGKHGVWIEFSAGGRRKRTATFLPEIAEEQGWSKKDTIDHLIRKSGFEGIIDEALRRSVVLTRYQSSKARLSYADYLAMKGV